MWRWLTENFWVGDAETGYLLCRSNRKASPDVTPYPAQTPQNPVPDASPNPPTMPLPRAGGARPARFHVTSDMLTFTAHWELQRQGRTVGVYGFSDLHGWWSAVAHGDDWETLPRSATSEEAKWRVAATCGKGRWRHVDSLHDVAW